MGVIDLISRLAEAAEAAEEASEVAHHVHRKERWMGLAGVPDGELHRGDPIGTTRTPFQMDGGAGAGTGSWGNWLQFVGSTDTPTDGTAVAMDMHRMTVVAVERANTAYFIQIAWGASGADALAAGDYTEVVYWAGAAVSRAAPVDVGMKRIATGTKMWIRCWAAGADTGTMDFYAGGHEYQAGE